MKPEVINNCSITKSCISKILSPWFSPRTSEYTKAHAVNLAIQILSAKHELDFIEFTTGTHSAQSQCLGRTWQVDRVTSTILEIGCGCKVLKIYDFSNFIIDD
jgi:ribosomal protein L11 methylase PrmA